LIRIFMAPGFYMQGPGALDRLGTTVAPLGRRVMIICDEGIRDLFETRLLDSCRHVNLQASLVGFSGEVTYGSIDALGDEGRARSAEVIVGVGGGRALDTAKGVALRLAIPIVTVPTVASTDAPASRGIAIYDESHRVAAVEQLPRNPAAILVDTAIIAAAPTRLLSAGIGDALSKLYEAEACHASDARNKHGTTPLLSALLIARNCFDTVRGHGAAAIAASDRNEATEDLERVVEAIVLMSCMAFENAGLSLAHAIAPALSVLGDPRVLHGEHVAYGTLIQGLVEQRPQREIVDLIGFCRDVRLPTSLEPLVTGDVTPTLIAEIAATAAAYPHAGNLRHPVGTEEIIAAMQALERLHNA
jgi:glycerol dehydrogenase